jgi:hypothetical protein
MPGLTRALFVLMCCREVNSYHKSKMIDYQIARQFGQTVRRPPYSPDPSPKARPKEARFQVVVGMPCVSERSENGWLEWGISCTGCRDRKPTKEEKQRGESPQIQLNKAKLYTRSGFVEHVLTCPYAQELLEANYGQIHQSNIEIPDDTSNSCALVSNGNNVTSGWGIWSLTPCTNFLVLHRSSVSSP